MEIVQISIQTSDVTTNLRICAREGIKNSSISQLYTFFLAQEKEQFQLHCLAF